MMKMRTRQQTDYRLLPITAAAARGTFEEEELEDNDLLRDILQGRISLEDRLEDMPNFQYNFDTLRRSSNDYSGSTIEELRRIWQDGHRETETEVTKSLLSRMLASLKRGLEGVLFDRENEVVVYEEASLEEKRAQAIAELKSMRGTEKKYHGKLKAVRGQLGKHIKQLEGRIREDENTFPRLGRFAGRLQDQIESTQSLLEQESFGSEERATYEDQVNRGQEYFTRLVNQMGYLRDEMSLLSSTRANYGKIMMRLESLIDSKEALLRKSLVKIKKAEMNQSLGVVLEAASYFQEMEEDMQQMDEINRESMEILDATFEAVDEMMKKSDIQDYSLGADNYRDEVYRKKKQEYMSLVQEEIVA